MEREQKIEHPHEITGWFQIDKVPYGDAPEEVRRDWVGVAIPIRARNRHKPNVEAEVGAVVDQGARNTYNSDDLVTVSTLDAVIALREAGRPNSAEWWLNWLKERDEDENSPTTGQKLIFLKEEGRILPPEEQDYRIHLLYELEFQPLLYVYGALGLLPDQRVN